MLLPQPQSNEGAGSVEPSRFNMMAALVPPAVDAVIDPRMSAVSGSVRRTRLLAG